MAAIVACEARGKIRIKVLNGIIQQLDHVFTVVRKGTGILHGCLVVVGGPEQACRKAVLIAVSGLVVIRYRVAVAVVEEIWIDMGVIDNGCTHTVGIGLKGRIKDLLQTGNLLGNALIHVIVSIVIRGRTQEPNSSQVLVTGHLHVTG